MPELPEVETTLRGIKPYTEGQTIREIIVRHPTLRWPIPKNINRLMQHQTIQHIERRGKYILFKTPTGTAILHLGMSGRLRVLTQAIEPQKHDHIDIVLTNNTYLRLTDPRRFGAFLWTADDPLTHPLLEHLGPEPLGPEFSGNYLWEKAQQRKTPIKNFIMDSHIVVGVGNIYAAEALHAASIKPTVPAGKISQTRYQQLAKEIKTILRAAIKQGGTTLKDFINSEGKPGYFSMHLKVYGRGGQPCFNCNKNLSEIKLGQRSSVYCPRCQK